MNRDSRLNLPSLPGESEAVPWKLLGALMLAALVLRAIGLDSDLWYDEIRTLVDSVRSPLLRIVTDFPGDNQHTFFSLLAHVSIAAFGEHAWSLRFPSLLLGAASVPMLYLLAREFTPKSEALLSALVLMFSYHHVWFSQSARGYAILTLLTLLSSWLLVRGLKHMRAADFIWYGVASALGVYTHVTMVFLVASHALLCAVLLGMPRLSADYLRSWRLPIIGFLIAAGLSVLLYLPVLLQVRDSVATNAIQMQSATPAWALGELIKGLRIGLGSIVAVVAAAVLLAVGSWSFLKSNRFLLGMAVVPAVLTFGATIALHRPVRPRFIVFLAGFAVMILVRGALQTGRWLSRSKADSTADRNPLGVSLALVICGLSALSLTTLYRYPKQDFTGARDYVLENSSPGEPVMVASLTTYPYQTYFGLPWLSLKSIDDLQSARESGRPVWVLYTMTAYVEPRLMEMLRTDCSNPHVFRGTVGGGDITVCRLNP